MNHRTTPSARETGFWASLPRLLAMLAIAVQCLVLQPHVHAFDVARASEAGAVASGHDHGAPTINCVVCRAGVAGRAFTPPPAIEAPAPDVLIVAQTIVTRAETALAVSSHSWRSRAPPVSLT